MSINFVRAIDKNKLAKISLIRIYYMFNLSFNPRPSLITNV